MKELAHTQNIYIFETLKATLYIYKMYFYPSIVWVYYVKTFARIIIYFKWSIFQFLTFWYVIYNVLSISGVQYVFQFHTKVCRGHQITLSNGKTHWPWFFLAYFFRTFTGEIEAEDQRMWLLNVVLTGVFYIRPLLRTKR